MTKILVAAILLLAARKDQKPPVPSAEQSAQLNEAEDMLNNVSQNEEGPEDRSPGPSNRSD